MDTVMLNDLSNDVLSLNVSTKFLHDFDVAQYSLFVNEPLIRVDRAIR